MYQVFLWIHILSYISWLLAFIASVFFAYKAGKTYETPAEKLNMQRERKATSIGAHIGAVGILISGGAMASMGNWGWFPFGQYDWLAIKQVVFIVILGLVGLSIKKSISFKKQIRGEASELISKQARSKWKSVYKVSLIIYVLVVLNTYLGLARPL